MVKCPYPGSKSIDLVRLAKGLQMHVAIPNSGSTSRRLSLTRNSRVESTEIGGLPNLSPSIQQRDYDLWKR